MIEIDEKYGIMFDNYNFILCEKKEDEEGNPFIEELTYHSELRGVLKSYAKKRIKKRKPKTFDDLKELSEEINDNILKCKKITIKKLMKEYASMRDAKVEKVKHLTKNKK